MRESSAEEARGSSAPSIGSVAVTGSDRLRFNRARRCIRGDNVKCRYIWSCTLFLVLFLFGFGHRCDGDRFGWFLVGDTIDIAITVSMDLPIISTVPIIECDSEV